MLSRLSCDALPPHMRRVTAPYVTRYRPICDALSKRRFYRFHFLRCLLPFLLFAAFFKESSSGIEMAQNSFYLHATQRDIKRGIGMRLIRKIQRTTETAVIFSVEMLVFIDNLHSPLLRHATDSRCREKVIKYLNDLRIITQ